MAKKKAGHIFPHPVEIQVRGMSGQRTRTVGPIVESAERPNFHTVYSVEHQQFHGRMGLGGTARIRSARSPRRTSKWLE